MRSLLIGTKLLLLGLTLQAPQAFAQYESEGERLNTFVQNNATIMNNKPSPSVTFTESSLKSFHVIRKFCEDMGDDFNFKRHKFGDWAYEAAATYFTEIDTIQDINQKAARYKLFADHNSVLDHYYRSHYEARTTLVTFELDHSSKIRRLQAMQEAGVEISRPQQNLAKDFLALQKQVDVARSYMECFSFLQSYANAQYKVLKKDAAFDKTEMRHNLNAAKSQYNRLSQGLEGLDIQGY